MNDSKTGASTPAPDRQVLPRAAEKSCCRAPAAAASGRAGDAGTVALTARIHFIKRAQELGFSLDEITELLRLEDGTHRDTIRRIASDRLDQIEKKLLDLTRMKKTLKHLVSECEHTRGDLPCPIIASLVQ